MSPTVGYTVPFGDLGAFAKSGPAFGVQGAYYLKPTTAIGVALVYNPLGTDINNVNFSIMEILAFGKLIFSENGSVAPYGKVAAGIFVNDVGIGTSTAAAQTNQSSSTDFGVGAGMGVQSRQNKWGWFGESMLMLDDFSDFYLGFRAGLNVYFGGSN